jgi:hypothetical protein
MADEATHLSQSSAPSVGRVGVTRYAVAASSSPGSTYELHDLPEKAKHIATPETRLDDEEGGSRTSRLNHQQREEMSRAPLLVRSSPAQGTGKLTCALQPCALQPPCGAVRANIPGLCSALPWLEEQH